MAKWYGMVGFVVTEETSQSVYEEVAKELPYYGEVTYNRHVYRTTLEDGTIDFRSDPRIR